MALCVTRKTSILKWSVKLIVLTFLGCQYEESNLSLEQKLNIWGVPVDALDADLVELHLPPDVDDLTWLADEESLQRLRKTSGLVNVLGKLPGSLVNLELPYNSFPNGTSDLVDSQVRYLNLAHTTNSHPKTWPGTVREALFTITNPRQIQNIPRAITKLGLYDAAEKSATSLDLSEYGTLEYLFVGGPSIQKLPATPPQLTSLELNNVPISNLSFIPANVKILCVTAQDSVIQIPQLVGLSHMSIEGSAGFPQTVDLADYPNLNSLHRGRWVHIKGEARYVNLSSLHLGFSDKVESGQVQAHEMMAKYSYEIDGERHEVRVVLYGYGEPERHVTLDLLRNFGLPMQSAKLEEFGLRGPMNGRVIQLPDSVSKLALKGENLEDSVLVDKWPKELKELRVSNLDLQAPEFPRTLMTLDISKTKGLEGQASSLSLSGLTIRQGQLHRLGPLVSSLTTLHIRPITIRDARAEDDLKPWEYDTSRPRCWDVEPYQPSLDESWM